MGARRLHHTGYTVSDLDRSVAFYRDLLGCEVLATQEKEGGYLARSSATPMRTSAWHISAFPGAST